MTAFKNLTNSQKIRAALHRDVRAIATETCHFLGLEVTKPAVEIIAELVYKKLVMYGTDLEAFCKHAKRATINSEDAKLMARRNPSLLSHLNKLAHMTPAPQKRRKTVAKPQKTPAKPQVTLTKPQETPAKPQETPTKPQKTPAKPQETPTKPQKAPAKPQETPTKPQKTPAKPQETPTKPQKTPAKPQETPAKPQETTNQKDDSRNKEKESTESSKKDDSITQNRLDRWRTFFLGWILLITSCFN